MIFMGVVYTAPDLFQEVSMRYYYEPPKVYRPREGIVYDCDHPLYNRCTLYLESSDSEGHPIGLAVVQQRFDPNGKFTYWSYLDSWLSYDIHNHESFPEVLHRHASVVDEKGLFPTIPVRQIMWELRMKPLPKEEWEKNFHHKRIIFTPEEDSPFGLEEIPFR